MAESRRVPSFIYKKALSIIESLHTAGNTVEFMKIFFDKIEPLIPHDTAVYFPIGGESRIPATTGYIDKNIPNGEDVALQYGSYYFALDPVKEASLPFMANRSIKYTDAAPMTKIMNGEFYQDFLKPIGVSYTMGLQLGFADEPIGGIGFHRAPRSSDFTERDKIILDIMAPHISYMLRNLVKAGQRRAPARSLNSKILKMLLPHEVTRRESEVILLVSQGLTNGEISEKLFITEQTVKDHLRSIYRKVKVRNRASLLSLLLSAGKRS